MKNKKLVISEDGGVEYVIKSKETKNGGCKMIMKTSKADVWCDHAKNVVRCKLTEIGDDYQIKMEDDIKLTLDASQLCDLYLLLNEYVNSRNNFMPKYKVIKS
jgi:hypothetical protein